MLLKQLKMKQKEKRKKIFRNVITNLSLLGNKLTGKGMLRAGYVNKKGKGMLRAVYWNTIDF